MVDIKISLSDAQLFASRQEERKRDSMTEVEKEDNEEK
jgi:hypothetical protein